MSAIKAAGRVILDRPRRKLGVLASPAGALALLGIVISGYLSYINLSGGAAICGGLGDCATVHASPYARLGGIPVSVLGLASYAAIMCLLVVRERLREGTAYLALLGVLSITVAGTVFSAYLTFLELNVIHALCPWCVASAAVIVLMFALASTEIWDEVSRR